MLRADLGAFIIYVISLNMGDSFVWRIKSTLFLALSFWNNLINVFRFWRKIWLEIAMSSLINAFLASLPKGIFVKNLESSDYFYDATWAFKF